MAKTTYVCDGSVRGSCGHRHKTLQSAIRCLDDDQRGCASQGGYSDRTIYAVQDGRTRRLTDSEADTMYDLMG